MKGTGAIAAAALVVGLLLHDGNPHGQPRDARACTTRTAPVVVRFDTGRYPHIVAHVRAAVRRGQPRTLHIERGAADRHRRAALAGIPTRRGYDRDEYPPAFSAEGGRGADVRYVLSGENRSSGWVMGQRTAAYCDGQAFRLVGGR